MEQSERSSAGHFDGQTPTMRAIVQDRYGESDVLRLEQIPRPVIGDNEVLLRVHAAAVGDIPFRPGRLPRVPFIQ